MDVIAITNQKGGVGKTTTAVTMAQAINFKGKKSLLIDLDPQGNSSKVYGAFPDTLGAFHVLTNSADPREVIQSTKAGDILTGGTSLAIIGDMLTGEKRGLVLKEKLKPLKGLYDAVIIDTPPTLGLLMLNALNASKKAIIPVLLEPLALDGLQDLATTIKTVQKQSNPELLAGALITQYETRTKIAQTILEELQVYSKAYDIPVLDTTIRRCVSIKEAQYMQESIYTYDPTCKPAIDYLQLLSEINI